MIKKTFELIDEYRKKTKNRFYGLWCADRFDVDYFDKYFEYETEMYNRGVEIHRLINIETVGEQAIREHLKKFSAVITSGKYIATSTRHTEFEMVVCFECKEEDDNNDTLAIQLLPDRYKRRVDLAIYSFDRIFMVSMTRFFERRVTGKGLQKYWDPNKVDESIDNWFQACKSAK